MRFSAGVYVACLVSSASCEPLWNPSRIDDHPHLRRLNEVDVNCTEALEVEEDFGVLELEHGGPKGQNDQIGSQHHWTCLVDSTFTGGVDNIDFLLPPDVEKMLDSRKKEMRKKFKGGQAVGENIPRNVMGLQMSNVNIGNGKIKTVPGKSKMHVTEKVRGKADENPSGETPGGKAKDNDKGKPADVDEGEIENPRDESPAGPKDKPSRGRGKRRLAVKRTGASKVLALWVEALDTMCTPTPSEISQSIFGGGGDALNLKSQFDSCSHGEMIFEPAVGPNIYGGVLNVEIDITVAGKDRYAVANAITTAAQSLIGGKLNQYDHVMYCIPPGTSGKWIGLGYYWWWRSLFNDEWILSPSCQMHEIGHNLDLRHAGMEGDPYGDISGYMGYSYRDSEYPYMCYNAAHSSFLGWYADKEVIFDPEVKSEWSGKLIGVADYGNADSSHTVIVKILLKNSVDGEALYLSYNSKRGANVGTQAYKDEVMIVEGAEELSTKVITAIPVGGVFTLNNFDGSTDSVYVTVESSGTDGTVEYVNVHLEAPCETDAQCDDGDDSNGSEKCSSNVCTAGSVVDTCKQSPPALISKPSGLGPNIAPGSTVTASSFFMDNPFYAPENAIDGLRATQWASWNERNDASLEIAFDRQTDVTHIGYLSRFGTDFVSKFVLTFSDGSCQVCVMDEEQKKKMQYFEIDVKTAKVDFQVVIGGKNSGAYEISLYAPVKTVNADAAKPPDLGPNFALSGSAEASSIFGTGYEASRAIDGKLATAWGSNGQGINAWLKITLEEPTRLTDIGYKSRPGKDFVSEFALTFSDGTVQKCKMNVAQETMLQYCNVGDIVTSTILFEVVAGGETADQGGYNFGAFELAAYGPEPMAGGSLVKPEGLGPNVARGAPVMASSYYNDSPYFVAKHATDGILSSQWASWRDGTGTWLRVSFTKLEHLTHLAYKSRTGADFVKKFVVKFSDGSSQTFGMNSLHQDKMQYFEIDGGNGVDTTYARFEVLEGGHNAGAYELALYASPTVIVAKIATPNKLGPNVVLGSSVKASSSRGPHTPENAVNGLEDDFWSSNGDGNNAWIKIDLGTSKRLTYLSFKSTEGEDFVSRFSMTFSDGSVQIGEMNAQAPRATQYFDIEDVNTETIDINFLSSGPNGGAYEIAAFSTVPVITSESTVPTGLGLNKAFRGSVSVSSYYNKMDLFDPIHAVDGILTNEWASQFDGNSAWMTIGFKEGASKITHVAYKSRKESDFVKRFSLTFSDGSKQVCIMREEDMDKMQYFDIDDVVTDSIRFDVENGGINSGAMELAAYAPPDTIFGSVTKPSGLTEDKNIVSKATVSAISHYMNADNNKPQKAVDGDTSSRWVSDSEGVGAWFLLNLGRDYHLTNFAFMSRPKDFVNEFTLAFSDGSTQICEMNANQKDKLQYFDIDDVVTEYVLLKVTKTSGGNNVGAHEIKMYRW